MKINSVNHFIARIALFLLALSVEAASLKSNKLNYAILIPDGWRVDYQNSSGFSITSPDNKKSIALLVHSVSSAVIDSNAVVELSQGFLQAGAKELSRTNFTADGIPVYEITQQIGKPPYASSIVIHLTITNYKLYQLQAMHSGGEITHDADMREALSSFHFLKPPKRSTSIGWGLLIPAVIIGGLILFWFFYKWATTKDDL